MTFTTDRLGHGSVAIGETVYVFGGAGRGAGERNTVEKAVVDSDGALKNFSLVGELTLSTGRSLSATAKTDSRVYVVAGLGNNGALDSVEIADITAGDSLSTFATAPGATLAMAREVPAAVIVGAHLYVLGGGTADASLSSVEESTIGSDGSLSAFSVLPTVALQTPRREFTASVIGDYLYVIGGEAASGYLNTVERALINTDGSLGPFAVVPGTTLVSARMGLTSQVIGNKLYIMGGINGPAQLMTSVEEAAINADGSLGTFETSPVSLSSRRGLATSAVIGKYLYVFGGDLIVNALPTVERAEIGPNGSLGSFQL